MTASRPIRWTKRALLRLDSIGAYIAKDNPVAADRVISRIAEAVGQLSRHPEMGRAGRVSGTRELVLSDVPYVVAYRIEPGEIAVLTVMHAAQRWPERL